MIHEVQVRAALHYMQDLGEDFPDFVVEYPEFPVAQSVYDKVDAKNMDTMRKILEVAEAARSEAITHHTIQEEP